MHLWEFLLELLAEKRCQSLIMWTRQEKGEFRIIKTEAVAKLWGFENGRQGMTYDKLSRALRQYYTDGIITKVRMKNWNAKCLHILRTLRKESYNESEINHLFKTVVLPNFLYGLAVYGALHCTRLP